MGQHPFRFFLIDVIVLGVNFRDSVIWRPAVDITGDAIVENLNYLLEFGGPFCALWFRVLNFQLPRPAKVTLQTRAGDQSGFEFTCLRSRLGNETNAHIGPGLPDRLVTPHVLIAFDANQSCHAR